MPEKTIQVPGVEFYRDDVKLSQSIKLVRRNVEYTLKVTGCALDPKTLTAMPIAEIVSERKLSDETLEAPAASRKSAKK